MSFRALLTTLLVLAIGPSTALRAAPGTSPYSDARFVEWKKLYQAGEYEALIRSAQADLESEKPHPFAARVWTVAHGPLDRALDARAKLGPALQKRLLYPGVARGYERGEHRELLEEFPLHRVRESGDVWSMHLLAWSAEAEDRHQDAIGYILAAHRQAQWFLGAWSLAADVAGANEKARVAVQSLAGGEFRNTETGTFLKAMLADRGMKAEVRARLSEPWLQRFPEDAEAIRFSVAQKDNSTAKWKESVISHAAALAVDPFRAERFATNTAIALVGLDRREEAEEQLRQWLSIAEPASVEASVQRHLAEAVREAGKEGAGAILTEALQRWPEDARLWLAKAEHETASNAAGAVEAAEKACALEPSLRCRRTLVKALTKASEYRHARTAWDTLVADRKPDSADYRVGLELFSVAGLDGHESLIKEAIAAYPGAAWIRRRQAKLLADQGRHAEAVDALEASFEIEGSPSVGNLSLLAKSMVPARGFQAARDAVDAHLSRHPWLLTLPSASSGARKPPVAAALPPPSHPRLVAQIGHPEAPSSQMSAQKNPITHTAASRASARALTVANNADVVVWDVASGLEIRRIDIAGVTRAIAVHPNGRRAFIAVVAPTMTDRHRVLAVDIETGQSDAMVMPAPVTSLAISQDGSTLAVAMYQQLAIYDAPTLKTRSGVPVDHVTKGVALSANGELLAVTFADAYSRVYATESLSSGGTELDLAGGKWSKTLAVDFDDAARLIVAGHEDGALRVWHAPSGVLLSEVSLGAAVNGAVFSEKGVIIAAAGVSVQLWKFETSEAPRIVADQVDPTTLSSGFEGRLLAGTREGETRVFASADGREIGSLKGETVKATNVSFSSDQKTLAVTAADGSIRVWETGTGASLKPLRAGESSIRHVAFNADGTGLIFEASSADGTSIEQRTGNLFGAVRSLPLVEQASTKGVFYSAAGDLAVVTELDGGAALLDLLSGRVIHDFGALAAVVNNVAFSPDGARVALATQLETVVVWSTQRAESLSSLSGATGVPVSVAFTDDDSVLVGYSDGVIAAWDLTSRGEMPPVWRHQTGSAPIKELEISAGGQLAAFGGDGTPLHIVRLTSMSVEKASESIAAKLIQFAPDGRSLFVRSSDIAGELWTVDEATLRRVGELTAGKTTRASFSADSRHLALTQDSGVVDLIRVETSEKLAELVAFRDGSWAVADVEGRYDASRQGNVRGLHWIIGSEPVELEQLKSHYYEPKLLAKLLGRTDDPLLPIKALSEIRLHPATEAVIDESAKTLRVHLRNRGGGIGSVEVFVNGKPIELRARGNTVARDASEGTLTIPLADLPMIPGEENAVTVVSSDDRGFIRHRGVELRHKPRGAASEKRTRTLYAVVAGISDYADPLMALRFAAVDAQQIGNALRVAAEEFFDAVHITILTSDSKSEVERPTKDNFARAFREAEKANPWDTVIVYLAGHGLALNDSARGEGALYVYPTVTARSLDPRHLAQVLATDAITSAELAEWSRRSPAQKQILILDTCAAGAAASSLSGVREISSDHIREIARTTDRTGVHILMGSAADRVSYEASQYGQGLLTYALLDGMLNSAILRNDGYVDVSRLFQHARDKVPELAAGIGGVQEPLVAAPRADSFDIGYLPVAQRTKIVLPSPKPVIVRPRLLNATEGYDDLRLEAALRRELRLRAEPARASSFVFTDADERSGAVAISGTYVTSESGVVVDVHLIRDHRKIATLRVNEETPRPEAVAERVVAQVTEWLASEGHTGGAQ
jgi:WD40 repeat protein/tetratricopeptide (TPR) repeat protein